MTNDQLYRSLSRMLSKIYSTVSNTERLVIEHLGDPITISNLQQERNELNAMLRELEYEKQFEKKK